MSDFSRRLLDLLFGKSVEQPGRTPSSAPLPAGGPLPEPVYPRVLAIIHNPVMRTHGGRKMNVAYGWNDPDWLAQQYANDIKDMSYGYAQYRIVERIEVDGFPLKLDGFTYTDRSFDEGWRTRNFHQPDAVDYLQLLREFDLI